jgi:hypothetical protein
LLLGIWWLLATALLDLLYLLDLNNCTGFSLFNLASYGLIKVGHPSVLMERIGFVSLHVSLHCDEGWLFEARREASLNSVLLEHHDGFLFRLRML